jgi:hypothetical protein
VCFFFLFSAIVPLNHTCEDDSQCLKYDHFAECNLLSKSCTCQSNYTQYENVCQSVITLGGNCVSNEQCSNQTANSLCFDRQCICAKAFVANQNGTVRSDLLCCCTNVTHNFVDFRAASQHQTMRKAAMILHSVARSWALVHYVTVESAFVMRDTIKSLKLMVILIA